ncbi:transposase family protein [Nostoc sp. UIC 10890]
MSDILNHIEDNPKQTQRLIGLEYEQLQQLIEIKKPINKELTTKYKKLNKEFSSKRVFVEHRIRSVKIFRVFQDRFRLNTNKYEQVILTICGLVRLRIGSLILPVEIYPMPSG